jgi:hypothetical protein
MAKLQESKGRFSVTLPKEYIEKKKWKKGETLLISFNERGNLEIADAK